MKQIFESGNICFVEVSELLIKDYLDMVNDEKNYNGFTGGKVKSFSVEQELKWVRANPNNARAIHVYTKCGFR